ncbi:DNA/RNA non-specific endonuclease [Paraburkholderia sp. CNPSo 3281]|uniref:DNA/RNA non-specific endonuclease n=1 Tax=Paraburkholderia sp. CNPSo 3281 TaxID=2940933 RepID=UPI0020B8B1CE|nr:DNA/RNA non-specific endonuclease [Paraburkholderia sp. CNPSo 3281]MCP3715620.1 DNA/RNA non-specific endonuclease [Paraburkholderia sp. CNPSo 3281]
MKKLFASLVASLLLAAASHAIAAPACSQFVPDGQFPRLTNQRMAPKTRMLCYSDFVVLHSGVTHGPLWSAEHLTRDHLEAAKDMTRTNRFFEDDRLPEGEGATLADYKRSGFDRGHMSPAGNRWNAQAMAESFSLANMVPQNRDNNQRLWAHIETAVRKLASKYGEAYVVTGPLFTGAQLQTIGATRVLVPTQIFKVVYVPSQQLAFAIVADNTAVDRYDVRSVRDLEAQSGIAFPGIPANVAAKEKVSFNGRGFAVSKWGW